MRIPQRRAHALQVHAGTGCGSVLRARVAGSAFDTKWHADATRAAMDQNGFSSDARLLCQFENYITDYYSGIDSELEQHVPESVSH